MESAAAVACGKPQGWAWTEGGTRGHPLKALVHRAGPRSRRGDATGDSLALLVTISVDSFVYKTDIAAVDVVIRYLAAAA